MDPLPPLDLRDRLALDRTALALERTALAYLRTSLGMIAAGVTVAQLGTFPDAPSWGAGVAAVGAAILLFGGVRGARQAVSLRALGRR